MTRGLARIYEGAVMERPVVTLVIIAVLVAVFGWFVPQFRLDASSDSLVLEDDADLRYYRSTRARYGSDDYLIVTYTPRGPMFSQPVLRDLAHLREALRAIDGVADVVTILDVPLLESPPVDLTELGSGTRTMDTPGVDPESARRELIASPLFRDLLVSADGQTVAIRIDLERVEEYEQLLASRDALRKLALERPLEPSELDRIDDLTRTIRRKTDRIIELEAGVIAQIRAVLDRHRSEAELFLGGVPMIVADSIRFIRHDLVVFGVGVFVFLVVILRVAFRRPRWILLPMLTCMSAAVVMMGFLALVEWRVTVVSSNFVALMMILTLSLTVHLIVRYRELHEHDPGAGQGYLVRATMRSKFEPCLYTVLTTMVGFGSLLVSGIRPVMDFGWMMVIGLAVAFLLAFTLFPAVLMLMAPGRATSRKDLTDRLTSGLADLVQRWPKLTLAIFVVIGIAGIAGATQLTVENRFIDYYKHSTEIYRGMERIDRTLGGTTPLDVIIDAPAEVEEIVDVGDDEWDDEWSEALLDEADGEAGITGRSFWLNSWQLPEVRRIHEYLDSLPETGKVISVVTAMDVLGRVEPRIGRDDFLLSIIHKRLPDEVKDVLFRPYLSEDGDQIRLSVRVFESDPTLRRDALLGRIGGHLTGTLGLAPEQVHLTGMLVLYNNMLQSLFRSQILTLGAVFIAILMMFLVLFQSLRIALISTVPTAVAAALVLGTMGWAGIPLDLMTITIAAITIGIGVDDTIHYVHRFDEEFRGDNDYWATVRRCHRSIGRARYYTSVTIMLGFSILMLSNFVPTIYFGLLTGFAMVAALLANLTLLPVMLVMFHAEKHRDRLLG
jgi:predicted RND superfamily exporter protein